MVGAGLGGLSAAASLAAYGFDVDVFEKNAHVGGKLNVRSQDGFTFDLGPSILTLPHIFRETFARAGQRMENYVPLKKVRPHWRNFFQDGVVLDLDPDPEIMKTELQKIGNNLEKPFYEFLDYSKRQYELVDEGYFRHGLNNLSEMLRFYGPRIVKLDSLTTMHRAVRRRLPNRHLQDIFDFFIKYVGSAATRAPGFMNLLPHIQFGYDLWYVDGGMHNLASGLEQLLSELGVRIHRQTEVTEIQAEHDHVSGVVANGERHQADYVVSNMEVIPAYRELLKVSPGFLRKLNRFEPACSGLVVHLGVDHCYDQLAHHNFFFSDNQLEHFRTVFKKKELPADPTVYVVAPSRSNPDVAPPQHDNIKILPHIPYINDDHPYHREDYMQFMEQVLDKLENMGLTDLRKHIVTQHVWTPTDIQSMYYSNAGSIYGVVCDIRKNHAFKAPRHSTKYRNLYFVGGSTNPGGGMPMVMLSGQLAADEITGRH